MENEIQNEFRIIGPPGTGKTSTLARQVLAAVRADKTVLVASLTRAAAVEAAGRDLPVAREAVGTLHSHAYRLLGNPPVADTPKQLREWNEKYPQYALSISRDIDEDNLDVTGGEKPGDPLYSQMGLYRARMVARDFWKAEVLAFDQTWRAWKDDAGLVDFTDMIELALEQTSAAPGHPDVIFVDEAQDHDTLEMALIRKWTQSAERLVIVGDPDQCLYEWRGANPSIFYEADLPETHERILSQSYRVPRAVHAVAEDWINQDMTRRPVDYLPRDAEGGVHLSGATWQSPEPLLAFINSALRDGRSIMLLATCSYMLRPTVAMLRAHGIPFHNPYRRKNGYWNPLQGARGKTSASDRLRAFLELSETGEVSKAALETWVASVKVKDTLAKDGKNWLDYLGDVRAVEWDDLALILQEPAIDAALSGDVAWLQRNLLAKYADSIEYPIQIYRHHGLSLLGQEPRVIVGTIHSTKGGEADDVVLFPDLSPQGYDEWEGDADQQAAVYRLFYVGMTRAKESLILCHPSSIFAVEF